VKGKTFLQDAPDGFPTFLAQLRLSLLPLWQNHRTPLNLRP